MSKYGNAFEQNELTIGADYLPSDVFNHVNQGICHGGGGGGSQTTTASIDPDIKRHVTPVLGDVRRLYESGRLGQVADSSKTAGALGQQAAIAEQTMQQGLGTENLLNELEATRGSLTAGQQGALGSARADRAREAALVDRATQLQQADLEAKYHAGQTAAAAHEGVRGLEQEVLDGDAKAAERFFGYLGAAPQSQTTTSTGGGGK